MSGSIPKLKKTLKILRGCEWSRLQRTTLEAAYELVTPTLRRKLATDRAAQPRAQAAALFATGTGGTHS